MEKKNEIVVYQPNETLRLEVCVGNDTVWLTQEQLCQLFGRERSVITKHLRNAITEGELDEAINVQILHKNQRGRPIMLYDLDSIISVGYRVKSLRGTQFRRWATKVLRERLLQLQVPMPQVSMLADEMDRHFSSHDRRIMALEEKVDFFVQTSQPPVQGVFYDGQVFDAHVFAAKHILSAKKSILLIDSWVDIVTLELLSKKAKGVKVEIVTSRRGNLLSASDIETFNEQYGGLSLRISKNFHDRYLIVDNKQVYLFGASLKDLGLKCFCAMKVEGVDIEGLKARI